MPILADFRSLISDEQRRMFWTLFGNAAGIFAGTAIGGPLGAIASAGLGIGTILAVNHFIPPPVLDLDAIGHSVTGAKNEMRPYGAVPRVFGKHRMYPPMAARPWTELDGEDLSEE